MNNADNFRLRSPLRAWCEPVCIEPVSTYLKGRLEGRLAQNATSVHWLDVGCGQGDLLRSVNAQLSNRMMSVNYIGFDCDSALVNGCNQTMHSIGARGTVYNGRFGFIPEDIIPDGTRGFDVISVVHLINDIHLSMIPGLILNLLQLCHDSTIFVFSDLMKHRRSARAPGCLLWSASEIVPVISALAKSIELDTSIHASPLGDMEAWLLTFDLSRAVPREVARSPEVECNLVLALLDVFEKRRSQLHRKVEQGMLEHRQSLQREHYLQKNSQHRRGMDMLLNGSARSEREPLAVTDQEALNRESLHDYWVCDSELVTLWHSNSSRRAHFVPQGWKP